VAQGLVALRRIELGGNRLQALPPELWQASALEHLGLAGNRLQRLDPGIGRLQRLQTLDLSATCSARCPTNWASAPA
jgi:internalin A